MARRYKLKLLKKKKGRRKKIEPLSKQIVTHCENCTNKLPLSQSRSNGSFACSFGRDGVFAELLLHDKEQTWIPHYFCSTECLLKFVARKPYQRKPQ
jgi:hypothetical protein